MSTQSKRLYGRASPEAARALWAQIYGLRSEPTRWQRFLHFMGFDQ